MRRKRFTAHSEHISLFCAGFRRGHLPPEARPEGEIQGTKNSILMKLSSFPEDSVILQENATNKKVTITIPNLFDYFRAMARDLRHSR